MAIAAGPAAAKTKVIGSSGGLTYVKIARTVLGAGSAPVGQRVTAQCPAGQRPTAGGGTMSGPSAKATIAETAPTGKRGWITTGWHIDDPAKRKLSAYAVCTTKATDKNGNVEPLAASPSTGGSNVQCDPGKYLTGGGVQGIGSGTTNFLMNAIALEVTGIVYAYLDHPSGPSGSVLASAVCINKLPAYKYRDVELLSGETKTVKQRCPAGMVTIGGSAFLSGNADDGHIVSSIPYDGKDKDKVPDDGWLAKGRNAGSPPSNLRAYVVCK